MHHDAGRPFGSLPGAKHSQSGSQLYLLRWYLAAVEGGGGLIELGVGMQQVVVINCNQHWNLQHAGGGLHATSRGQHSVETFGPRTL